WDQQYQGTSAANETTTLSRRSGVRDIHTARIAMQLKPYARDRVAQANVSRVRTAVGDIPNTDVSVNTMACWRTPIGTPCTISTEPGSPAITLRLLKNRYPMNSCSGTSNDTRCQMTNATGAANNPHTMVPATARPNVSSRRFPGGSVPTLTV